MALPRHGVAAVALDDRILVPAGGVVQGLQPTVSSDVFIPCYANCDGSTGTPALTANDFQCFIIAFAAGIPYANCDGSSGSPPLTANDFQCFVNEFAGGC
jgi:hypothetical protein